ncbi:hypothetical protein GCM10027341_06080 [Spirosoma knui]
MERLVLTLPSEMISVPLVALVKARLPLRLYRLVVEKQSPLARSRVRVETGAAEQEAGAV